MAVQFLSSLKTIFAIISIILLVMTTFTDLIGFGVNALFCPECSDAKGNFLKALVYATAGSDDSISRAVNRLKVTQDPIELTNLRYSILSDVFIITVFWILIKNISKTFMKGSEFELGSWIVANFVLPVLIISIIEIIGMWYVFGTIKIPFVGIGKLLINLPLFFKMPPSSIQ